MVDSPPVFQIEGMKTLPCYVAMAQAQESIRRFDKGRVMIQPVAPEYPEFTYDVSAEWLDAIGKDAVQASRLVSQWMTHITQFLYFIQLKDDNDRRRIRSLSSHTELVSTLCDARLGIDTSILWTMFDAVHPFESIHIEYRADDDREARYADYAQRLDAAWQKLSQKNLEALRLIERIIRQIQLKAGQWATMEPLSSSTRPAQEHSGRSPIKLFYSYSHKDGQLRDELETHLSSLQRQGVIVEWHDRKITAGMDWKDQIDANLKAADIILLLISADFIASDYCYDIEMKLGLQRHETRDAKVIPIILRACDWQGTPFGKLQALPRDAKPITSWSNIDEALADVAKGIRKVSSELQRPK